LLPLVVSFFPPPACPPSWSCLPSCKRHPASLEEKGIECSLKIKVLFNNYSPFTSLSFTHIFAAKLYLAIILYTCIVILFYWLTRPTSDNHKNPIRYIISSFFANVLLKFIFICSFSFDFRARSQPVVSAIPPLRDFCSRYLKGGYILWGGEINVIILGWSGEKILILTALIC